MTESPTTWREAATRCLNAIWETGEDQGLDNLKLMYDEDRWLDLAYTAFVHCSQGGRDLLDLLCSKQSDYGSDNIMRFGEDGLNVRLWDKIARLQNLNASGKGPLNESVDDTLTDIVGYSILRLMLRYGWMELPLESEAPAQEYPTVEELGELEVPEPDAVAQKDEPPRKVVVYEIISGDYTREIPAIGLNVSESGVICLYKSEVDGDTLFVNSDSWDILEGHPEG